MGASRDNKAAAVMVVGGLVAFASIFASFWLGFVVVGITLILISLIPEEGETKMDEDNPNRDTEPPVDDKRQAITIPERSNIKTGGLQSYQQSRNVLAVIVDNFFDRIGIGEEIKTTQLDTELLKQQLERGRVLVEARKLSGEYDRLQYENQTKTTRAQGELERVKDENELTQIKMQADKKQEQLRIAETDKKIADLKKPAPEPPKPPNPAEEKKRNRDRVWRDIEENRKEKEMVTSDPKLNEDEKLRRANYYDDREQKLFEELGKYK